MENTDVKVSFTILTHNENESLKNLLNQLYGNKSPIDEIVIVDDYSDNKDTAAILEDAVNNHGCKVFQNKLNGDFSLQKNFAAEHCANEYIFNIDSDELLDENLLKTYKEILFINKEVELFFLPRVNKVNGLTLTHTQSWKWQIGQLRTEIEDKSLTPDSDEYKFLKIYNLIIMEDQGMVKFYTPIINWPDWQGRIYKNNGSIHWVNKVHEVVVNHKKYARLPQDKKFSLLHYKDITKQEQQNNFYQTIAR